MRKFLLIWFLFASGFFAFSQNTPIGSFRIEQSSNPESNAYFESCIFKSNLESYRLKSNQVELNFSNGFKVILLSADAAIQNGVVLPLNDYPSSFPAQFRLPEFEIKEGGILTAKYPTISKGS